MDTSLLIQADGLKPPLMRKIGILCPVTWEEALSYVSKKFTEIVNEHGGKAIGGIGSEKCTNEDNYLFQKFCRTVLGTNNIDNLSNIKSPSLNQLIKESVKHGIATGVSGGNRRGRHVVFLWEQT